MVERGYGVDRDGRVREHGRGGPWGGWQWLGTAVAIGHGCEVATEWLKVAVG